MGLQWDKRLHLKDLIPIRDWVNERINNVQAELNFDDVPKDGSQNLMKSGDIKKAIDIAVTSMYRFKGSCKTSDLPTEAIAGDVWNLTDNSKYGTAGTNVAWTGSDWDALSGNIEIDKNVSEGSNNPVSSDGVAKALKEVGTVKSVNGINADDNGNVSIEIPKPDLSNIDAKTVNGHSVNADVPENAEFTDTKYDDSALKKTIETVKKDVEDIKKNESNFATMASDFEKSVENYYALRRTGKVYVSRMWDFASNSTAVCEKLRDNANLVCEGSTDSVEGRDDYADIPLFQWVHVNYVRDDDGAPRPIAIEGTKEFKIDGAYDVGTMQMSFWWNVLPGKTPDGASYVDVIVSDLPNDSLGLVPWSECVKADKTILPWCIASSYMSGKASDGLLRSQPGLPVENFQSYNTMLNGYPKKGKGYHGAGAERNTFLIIMMAIKYGTKSSQSVFAGCTNYNFQYSAAVKRTENETYFPVTASQANSIDIGSAVSVGYGQVSGSSISNDRGNSSIRKYANKVKVTKKETMKDGNVAIYLDTVTGFPTADVKLNDTLTAPVIMSSMPYHSGSTDCVIGRHDGSKTSNTNGHYPYRVQGREYSTGAYVVASDTVMVFQSDYSKDVYVAVKGTARSESEATIKANYKKIGNIPNIGTGSDFWIGDVGIDTESSGWYPKTNGSSNQLGMGDRCYAGGASVSGTRAFFQGGTLGAPSGAGSSFLYCGSGLGGALWNCCAAD